MKELYVFCEGPTEQGFCNQVLFGHLFPTGEGCIHTVKIAHTKHHGKVSRGGVGKYASFRRDIHNTLRCRQERTVFFTTLIDLYALPSEFPGKADHVRDPGNPMPYVLALENELCKDINDYRFIPHIQLHEYETMLFTDPEAFRIAFDGCERAIALMKAIVESVPTIEHIDDGHETAPSKRIIDLIPAYLGRKTSAGPDVAAYIGLASIRAKCAHFNSWLTRLETIDWGGA